MTTRTRSALPLSALLSLATAVFITCLTEILPAGLLPAMSRDLGVGESAMGQSVTVFAIGTAVTAIPLTAATAGWPRKRLLLVSMAGFCVANTVTALSGDYPLTMVARFVAGVAAGLAWALLAGYARRLAPAGLEGRAIAVAMSGIPVALSIGVPVGTYLGKAADWRIAFLVMSGLTVLLLGWITVAVPERPGAEAGLSGDGGRRGVAREEGAGREKGAAALCSGHSACPGLSRSSSSPPRTCSRTPSSTRTSRPSSTASGSAGVPTWCCSPSGSRRC